MNSAIHGTANMPNRVQPAVTKSKYHLSNKLIGGLFQTTARILGYRFTIATTPEELAEAYRLREAIFADELYDPQVNIKFPDKYDANAIVFIAWYKDKIIGTMRLIKAKELSLILDCYNFSLEPHVNLGQVLEFGGLVVDKKYRGKAKFAFLGMCNLGFQYSLDNNYIWWMGVTTLRKIAYFRKLNTDCEFLDYSPPDEKHMKNRERYPGYFKENNDPARPFLMNNLKGSYLEALWRGLRKNK